MSNKEIILNYILNTDCHPTADDIHQHLRISGKKITLATVYNNLRSLCEEGKIRNLSLDPKCERFDKPLRHDHLVCSRCGKISDIFMSDLTAQLSKCCNVALDSYDLKLVYCCDECKIKIEEKEN